MSAYGKTVRIYLADGNATGIRHAEVVNWTGQAVVCPKNRIGELASWPESQRPGVYLLFGEDSDTGAPRAYIGEAESVLKRLHSHVKHKDFWSHVIFFSSKDENLTKAHVKYLESKMISLADSANRVVLENSARPALPSLPRADCDAMGEFLDFAKLLLGALGSSILQPLPTKPTDGGDNDLSEAGPLASIRLFLDAPTRGRQR